MDSSTLGYIFIFVVSTIFILALLSNGVHHPTDDGDGKENVIKTVVMEALENKDDGTMPTIEDSFCEVTANYSMDDIDKKCKTLSDKNCSLLGCCVYLNGEKCVGGTSTGPTYLSENGENIDVKYYRHKTKVYNL